MLDIGLEIKILRERLKVSSKDLAGKVGLSQSQMSRLEKGQRRIDTGVLHRVAVALGVDPAFFFRSADDAGSAQNAPGVSSPPAAVPRIRHDHIGKLIRSERRKRHLSVDELATRVGKTKAYIVALEEGRHALDGDLADRMCRALRLSVNFFVEVQQEAIVVLEKQVTRLDQALAEAHRGPGGAGEAGNDTARKIAVPLYGALGAGLQLGFEAGDEPFGEPADFLSLPGLEGGRCFAVAVSGDAMESTGNPSFRDGDIVVFGGGVVKSRDFVLVKLADDTLVFRQAFFDPRGSVRFQPLNLNHAAMSRQRQDLKSMWRLAVHIARA